ncbi:MAG: V-type ATP synthase subunit F, partial [Treponema sp.]|nr:V-type ATP synthase subunit F [Treponema sp.]
MDYYFIGDEELVAAFRFIGIDGLAVKDADEAVSVFRKITEGSNYINEDDLPDSIPDKCEVLILTEETADWLGDLMINWQLSGSYPLLV